MKILGNMQLLFSCSRVLICFRYQNGYCWCRGSLDCVEFKKLKKKKRKMKNRVLQQTLFYFCVFTSWTLFWGSIRIGKIVWERCARQKNFLNFWHQLRCANFENFAVHINYLKSIVYLIALELFIKRFKMTGN